MKKSLSFIITVLLSVFFAVSLTACSHEEPITNEEARQLVAENSHVREYLLTYKGSTPEIRAELEKVRVSGYAIDYKKSYESNKQRLDDTIHSWFEGITKCITPAYRSDAEDINKYAYAEDFDVSGIKLGGKLKFNDLVGGMFGAVDALAPVAIVMGAGRANFTAGEIVDTESPAILAYNEVQKIYSKEFYSSVNSELIQKMFAANKVSDIFRSRVVSFNNDGRFAMSTHYTKLGAEYMTAHGQPTEINQEYNEFGTYEVSYTSEENSNNYALNVTTQNGDKLDFVINTATGEVYQRNYIFTVIPFKKVDEKSTSASGYPAMDFDSDTEKYIDIAYGNRTMQALQPGDEGYDASKPESEKILNDRQKLDIFVPQSLDKNRKGGNGVIMFIHGGSWTSGEKESMTHMCAYYTRMGYVTATMNHTYAARKYDDGSVVTFAEIENEIDMAFRKIKEMSDEYGWNITKGATCGYSSGSHLAAYYAYDKGNEADAPIPIVMTFSLVGPMSFYLDCWTDGSLMPLGPQVASIGLNDMNMFTPDEDKLDELQKQLADVMDKKLPRSALNPMDWTPYDEETYKQKLDSISPLSFVKRGDAVPTVLGESMLDIALISGEHGRQMEAALTEQNIEHDVIMFANSDHTVAGNAESCNVFRMRTEQYLKKYFGY